MARLRKALVNKMEYVGDSMELEMLRKVVAEVLNVDEAEVHLSTTFVEDLGADSLDLLQIVMGMEEKLGVEIPAEAVDSIVTVEDAINAIRATVA